MPRGLKASPLRQARSAASLSPRGRSTSPLAVSVWGTDWFEGPKSFSGSLLLLKVEPTSPVSRLSLLLE